MNQYREVKTADFAVGQSPQILLTHGIGSCVVVCFYSFRLKMGALGHFMLPKAPVGYTQGYKYVDLSLDLILEKMITGGAKKDTLIVSLVGGAQMFKVLESPIMNIGQRNVEEAKKWLSINGMGISLIDVGGHSGRNVEFNLETGVVKVSKNV